MTDAPTPRDVIGPILIPDGHSDREREVARSWADDIITAISAAGWVVEQGWQPIATAPRDGTEIFAAFEGQFKWVIFKAYSGSHGVTAPGHAAPTHWRPIPAGPKDAP